MKKIVILTAMTLILLVLSCLDITIHIRPEYQVENDDSFAYAQQISISDNHVTKAISVRGDRDFYYFIPQSNSKYRIELIWLTGSNLDLSYNLYDGGQNLIIIEDENGYAMGETGELTTAQSGGSTIFYIEVQDYADKGIGEYSIKLTKVY